MHSFVIMRQDTYNSSENALTTHKILWIQTIQKYSYLYPSVTQEHGSVARFKHRSRQDCRKG